MQVLQKKNSQKWFVYFLCFNSMAMSEGVGVSTEPPAVLIFCIEDLASGVLDHICQI